MKPEHVIGLQVYVSFKLINRKQKQIKQNLKIRYVFFRYIYPGISTVSKA